MRYAILIYGREADEERMTPAERQQQMGAFFAFTTAVKEAKAYAGGEALHPTSSATTVRVNDGKTLTTDGPFAETKEQLGGFYLLDCKDLDEAIQWAARIPSAIRGSVEVRPVIDFSKGGKG